MSVLSEHFRTKRYDFSRIGIQYEHDDENASSSSSSSSSVKRKKPRCPPGSRRDKKTGRCISKTTGEAVEERTPVRKPKSKSRASAAVVEKPVFVPYPLLASTITSSKVIKLLYDGSGMSNKKFCWDLHMMSGRRRRNKYEFSGITQMMYFPTGQILEDEILNLVDNFLMSNGQITMERQTQQGGQPKPYQKDAAERMGIPRWERVDRPNGFADMVSNDLRLWGHPVKCRADGLTDTHVIEVKAPFGSLYKVWKSGEVVHNDTYGVEWVTYNKDAEIFIIPPNYMAQLLIEMNCYNKKKAYFGQLYSYQGWYSIAKYYDTQYQQIQRGGIYPFRKGTIVYTPCLDKSTPILTIINRLIKIVRFDDTISLEVGRAVIFHFLYDYVGCLPPPDGSFTSNNARAKSLKFKPGEASAIEDWIEEHWRPRLDDIFIFMTDQRALELFDFDTLEGTTITFSYYQRQKIREELLFGQRKDIMRGEIKADQNVLWDGALISQPQLSKEDYVKGLKTMMKHILNKVRRMNHKAWRKFKFPLLDFDIWGDFPPLDDTKDELVILEVDLSKPEDYEEAMNRLKNFFIDCEMVTRGLLQCKGREPKRMTGKTGKEKTPLGERDKFIEWLKSVPAREVHKEELRI